MQLQASLNDLSDAGLQVVAISYDSTATLKKFADKEGITFPLLSDPESSIINAYAIRNVEADKNAKLNGVPHPGTFIIDGKGVIRMKLGHEGYKKRHSVKELLTAAEKIAAD